MSSFRPPPLLLGLLFFFFFIRRANAFGAGNIAGVSKVEGQNWRHGDIEDTLLQLVMARAVGGKKFDKINVSRVYFGNWLRDYSQAIDVGTVKNVSAEAIRLLLCVLGFLTFGYGSREFEVTADRLGCYRPEDHIDNPKNYADNVDARQYDQRLRGPVDERVELAIDPESGMKNYIANENARIMTSAQHVRKLFSRCIELGRSYASSNNKSDFYEALRLMGTGLHCLEDFLAHSNYTELALIEMGERDVFPHVGRNTKVTIEGGEEVYPLVTGTFGGVDFLHSVTGEVSDKLTQNEIQQLEGTLENDKNKDTSYLRNLLDMIPDGLFGQKDQKQQMEEIQNNANAAQMEQMSVSPLEPEEYTVYIQNVFKQIMPAIEFHDEILKSVSEAIEQIPVLPKIVEQLEDQLSVFVFSVIAPFIIPVIKQIKNELQTGSSEIIESSKNEQLIVFNDDDCTDPTHSMLSKDHFSNILNEIAGGTASKIVAWVVPQLMDAWDNEGTDVDSLLNNIIFGVMHHPAQRKMGDRVARECRKLMYESVKGWWNDMSDEVKDDYRRKLSREGVENGENHKEGVEDCGHGCGKPLGMHKSYGAHVAGETMEDRIASAAAGAIIGGVTSGVSNIVEQQTGVKLDNESGGGGGGGGGGILGGFLSSLTGGGSSHDDNGGGQSGIEGIASSLLGGGFQKSTSESQTYRTEDSTSESYTQYGRNEEGTRYAQAEYTRTQYNDGGERREYQRYEQDEDRRGEQSGGSYERREDRRYDEGDGGYRREAREEREEYGGGGRREEYREEYGGGGGYGGPGGPGGFGGPGGPGGFGGRGYDDEHRGPPPEEYGRREEYGEREDYGSREDYGRRNEFGRRDDEYEERRW